MPQILPNEAEFRVPVKRALYEEFKKEFPFYGFVRLSLEAYLEEMIDYSKKNPMFRKHAAAAAHSAIRRIEEKRNI